MIIHKHDIKTIAGKSQHVLCFRSNCKMLNLFKGHFIRYFQYFRYRKDEKGHHSEIDPFELQICIIQGTRNGIDRCLELIREKFPLQQYQVCLFHLLKMLSRSRQLKSSKSLRMKQHSLKQFFSL